MKILKIIIPFIFLSACSERENQNTKATQPSKKDTVVKHDTVFYRNNDWQQGFNLTHDPQVDSVWGKPVKFYIDNPKCSPIAIDFYLGEFRPTDNHTTAALLSLATTDNDQLRPFYRWCLNKTIVIQDGALGEYTGEPARQYAEKFPKEFFEYMDDDSTGEKLNNWVEAISYSGYYENEDYKKAQEIRQRMIQKMKRNCNNCNDQVVNRIEKFATDCFQLVN